MSKQTAVEWLQHQLNLTGKTHFFSLRELIEQALQIEKEQHEDTWLDSRLEDKGDNYIGKEKSFEQYFTENYGNNK
jgi:hypothetical protein